MLLFEGKEGAVNLKSTYTRLNKQYFGGALPMIKLDWSARLTNAVGKAYVAYMQRGRSRSRSMSLLINRYAAEIAVQDVEIDMKSLKITVSKKYDLTANDIDAVMIHEMCHIKLYIDRKIIKTGKLGYYTKTRINVGIVNTKNNQTCRKCCAEAWGTLCVSPRDERDE